LQHQKKVSGRNSHLKTLEDEVLFVLIYYRFHVTHEFLGYLFNDFISSIGRPVYLATISTDNPSASIETAVFLAFSNFPMAKPSALPSSYF
jgi:hypothetical protein